MIVAERTQYSFIRKRFGVLMVEIPAYRVRQAIPGALRRPLGKRLGAIVPYPEAPHRGVLSAVSAILTVSKINLANIALTIKVQTHEELEERVTEIERRAGLGKPE